MFYSEKAEDEEPGVIEWWPGARPKLLTCAVVDDCKSFQVPDSCSSVVRAKVAASKFHSE